MKKLGLTTLALAMAATSMPAHAAPENKAPNAAYPTKGTGCLVRGGQDQPYTTDPDCNFHWVRKYDKDGNLVSYKYQDKGTVQPGQSTPDRPVRTDLSAGNCTGTEIVTPSGQYTSNYMCTF